MVAVVLVMVVLVVFIHEPSIATENPELTSHILQVPVPEQSRQPTD